MSALSLLCKRYYRSSFELSTFYYRCLKNSHYDFNVVSSSEQFALPGALSVSLWREGSTVDFKSLNSAIGLSPWRTTFKGTPI